MQSTSPSPASKPIALYHVIRSDEQLAAGAEHVLRLLQKAQHDHPGRRRTLFLDIEGHCARDGGFTPEANAFVTGTVMDFFGPFISELRIVGRTLTPQGPQRDDIPDRLPAT